MEAFFFFFRKKIHCTSPNGNLKGEKVEEGNVSSLTNNPRV